MIRPQSLAILRLILHLTLVPAAVLSGAALATAASAGPSAGQAVRAVPFQSDRIVVSTRGSGPDVILIPGLASTGEVWRATADRLDDRYRVHIVSVRGFGDIPAGANAHGQVIAPVADELRRYIAERNLVRPALIGHSMGGLVALRVAAVGGDRIGRVMAVDAAPFFPALISDQATVRDIEPLARLGYQTLLLLGDQALQAPEALLGGTAGGLGGAPRTLFGAIGWQGGDRTTLAQGFYEVLVTDLRGLLPRIAAPVTVVYGWSADSASPRAHVDARFQQSYRRLSTPARFERIEGAEHMVMIDRPDAFLAVVRRFLA